MDMKTALIAGVGPGLSALLAMLPRCPAIQLAGRTDAGAWEPTFPQERMTAAYASSVDVFRK
jgi:hypothetical protein